jgi:hypothetical protein
MNTKQSKLPIVILMAFFVGLHLFLAARPVAASGSPWVRWKINLDFPNDKLAAELTIQRGYTTQSGKNIVDEEETFPIPCLAQGTPIIINGQAIFDGNSNYQCDVPSIREEVRNTWGEIIPDACTSKLPYVIGKVSIEGNPIDANPQNPVFYRDDIRFGIPLNVSTQRASLMVRFGQDAVVSNNFAINPASHIVAAFFSPTSPTSFDPIFVVDGNYLNATPATINQPVVISNLASTVYFGYSPVSGEYFEGTLGPLEVDPVCPTTG